MPESWVEVERLMKRRAFREDCYDVLTVIIGIGLCWLLMWLLS